MYWAGYLYRYWHILTKESSKEIYAQAPAKTMNTNYLMFHTMAPELAIEDLKELHQQKKHSKNKKRENQNKNKQCGVASCHPALFCLGKGLEHFFQCFTLFRDRRARSFKNSCCSSGVSLFSGSE